jgi:hypothetical protein
VDPGVLPTVDPEYWETKGARDGYRFPTIYPYSIEAADRLNHGSLTTWDAKRAREGGAVTPLVGGITHLSFDRRFLLARTEQGVWTSPEAPPERWVLFDFQTRKSESFASREELEQAAAARGYQGDLDLKSVAEHYEECSP